MGLQFSSNFNSFLISCKRLEGRFRIKPYGLRMRMLAVFGLERWSDAPGRLGTRRALCPGPGTHWTLPSTNRGMRF